MLCAWRSVWRCYGKQDLETAMIYSDTHEAVAGN